MAKSSRTENSLKNISMGFISKFTVMIVTFIDRTVFIKLLIAELLGINGLFSNILLVLSLAELGMTNVMIYSYYEPLATGDNGKLSALTSYYKKIYSILAIVVAIIGVLITPFLKYIINLETQVDNIFIIYFLFLANTVISYLFVYKSTVLTADQSAFVASKIQIFFDIFRSLIQIIILIITKNYLLYLFTKIFFSFLYNYTIAKYAEKKYPFINMKKDLDKESKTNIKHTIKSGFIYKLSSILLNGTDNILISMIVGTIWIGYITNYDTIISSIMSFVVILFTSLTASIGNLSITENSTKRLEIFNVMLYIAFWLSRIIIPCMFFLMSDLIYLWIGPQYILPNDIFIAKLISMYLSCCLYPIFSFRDATGLYKKTKYSILAAALCNIFLSIILGYLWGVFGILIASVIAVLVSYVWYEPILLYDIYFSRNSIEYFKKHLYNIFLLIITFGICAIFMKKFPANTWSLLILKAIVCFFITNIVNIILTYKQIEFKYLVKKLSNIVSYMLNRR